MTSSAKIAGIILAGGESRRWGKGKSKLLLPFSGKTLIERVVRSVLESSFDYRFVILGWRREEVLRAVRKEDRNGKIIALYSERFSEGKAYSIRKAIKSLPGEVDAALFLLGDQPLVSSSLMEKVMSAYRTSRPRLCFPEIDGRKGNPALFDRSLFPELLKLEGDRGGLEIVRRMWDKAVRIPIDDPLSQLDVDTQDDYDRLKSMKRERGVD